MRKAKIMVVDDDVNITTRLEKYLTSMGYHVVGKASSGEEALEIAKRLRPDLILMDIVMPGPLDGIDASERIKAELDTPVIFLTAYADDEFIKRAENVKPFGYIVKPFQEIELKTAIECALDEKDIERRLRESEELYRTVVENIADAIVINVGTKRVFVNNAYMVIHGLHGMSQALETPLGHFILPEDRQLVQEQILARQRNHPVPGTYEYRIRRPDGEVQTLEALAVTITYQRQPAALAVLRDVTERRAAEEALAISKSYTESIIYSLLDTLIVVDMEAKIKTVNPATCHLLGYTEDELIGRSVATIFAAEEEEEEEEELFKSARLKRLIEEGSVRDYEMTYKTKAGEKIPVSFSGSMMSDKDGNLVGIVGIARDMREIKRLFEKEKEFAAAAAAAAGERKKAAELERAYKELWEKSERLERFHKVTVGRELEMVKLKGEVNTLLEKLGQPKKYEAPDKIKVTEVKE